MSVLANGVYGPRSALQVTRNGLASPLHRPREIQETLERVGEGQLVDLESHQVRVREQIALLLLLRVEGGQIVRARVAVHLVEVVAVRVAEGHALEDHCRVTELLPVSPRLVVVVLVVVVLLGTPLQVRGTPRLAIFAVDVVGAPLLQGVPRWPVLERAGRPVGLAEGIVADVVDAAVAIHLLTFIFRWWWVAIQFHLLGLLGESILFGSPGLASGLAFFLLGLGDLLGVTFHGVETEIEDDLRVAGGQVRREPVSSRSSRHQLLFVVLRVFLRVFQRLWLVKQIVRDLPALKQGNDDSLEVPLSPGLLRSGRTLLVQEGGVLGLDVLAQEDADRGSADLLQSQGVHFG